MFVQSNENRKEVIDFLEKSDEDLLDLWFESHNTLPQFTGTFDESGFRPYHATSLLVTIVRSEITNSK